MDKFVAALIAIPFLIVVFFLIACLLAFPTMWLWNALLTGDDSIIGVALPVLTFWRALGLNVLCGILFKGSSPSSSTKNS